MNIGHKVGLRSHLNVQYVIYVSNNLYIHLLCVFT